MSFWITLAAGVAIGTFLGLMAVTLTHNNRFADLTARIEALEQER